MKTVKNILILVAFFMCFSSVAQSGINYKALIKDDLGNVVANNLIQVQFSILQGVGLINIYSESHTPTTDANGIIIINIGEGSVNSGDFTTIDWASDDHFLNVQINTGGGLVDMGTTEFKTVPYAIHSATTNDHNWTKNGSVIYTENESIGIGTMTPNGKLDISYSSTLTSPQINLVQENNGFARISFQNTSSTNYWTLAALSDPVLANSRFNIWNGTTDILSITGDGIVGVSGTVHVSNTNASGINVLNAGVHGLQITSSDLNGINVGSAGAEGMHISSSVGHGIHINNAGFDGLKINSAANDGISIETTGNIGIDIGTTIDDGIQINSAGLNGLDINNAGSNGINIGSANNYGIRVQSSGNTGLLVQSAGAYGVSVLSANNIGGFFKGTNSGVHAESSIDINPDLILGATSGSSTGDDGIISSDPFYSSSDIRLNSNDAVVIRLDQDNDENGNFQIKSGDNTTIFDIDERGNVNFKLTNTLVSDNGYTFKNNLNNTLFNITIAGNATLSGTLTQNSDRRLKKDITTLSYGLNEILQLQPKEYFWKNKDEEKKSFGLIAQDVQLIIDEVVTAQNDEEKTLGISYIELIPVLINAIQEQQTIIKNQNTELSNLVSRVEKLEKNNSNLTTNK